MRLGERRSLGGGEQVDPARTERVAVALEAVERGPQRADVAHEHGLGEPVIGGLDTPAAQHEDPEVLGEAGSLGPPAGCGSRAGWSPGGPRRRRRAAAARTRAPARWSDRRPPRSRAAPTARGAARSARRSSTPRAARPATARSPRSRRPRRAGGRSISTLVADRSPLAGRTDRGRTGRARRPATAPPRARPSPRAAATTARCRTALRPGARTPPRPARRRSSAASHPR